MDSDGSIDSDESFTREVCKRVPHEANYRLTLWSGQTHYDVVKEVAKFDLDYHLIKFGKKAWDVAWWDGPIPMNIVSKM